MLKRILTYLAFFVFMNWGPTVFLETTEIKGVSQLPFGGMVVYPFILYKEKNPSEEMVFHEKIHEKQIKKHGVVVFYTFYAAQYLYYLLKFENSYEAYVNIGYENEAYTLTNKEFYR